MARNSKMRAKAGPLKASVVSPIWPFTTKASRRIQMGGFGRIDPEIDGAYEVHFIIRGVYPGPEAVAAIDFGLKLFRAHTPAVMWKGAAINGTDTKR